MRYISKIWHRLFLIERPSLSLSLFRVAVAITVGAHVIPTLFNLPDNYYSTALKTYNFDFFTPRMIECVQRSPDQVVLFFVIFFYVTWLFFFIGLFSQISCIFMTLACYYFYALNSLHVGTLSWDILLVTLFLMCLTPYHGDYFSVDALRRGDPESYKRKRPFFIQRLLQIQIALTFFYTALYKITGAGNWLKDNPIHYLMNYPPAGVTKWFLLRDFFRDKPELCYATGLLIVAIEISMPVLLFLRRARLSAIYLGCFFHLTLILTLDVPAIFFFLFPPQLFLFINPDHIVRWIEQKRCVNAQTPQSQLIYDGHCGFCQKSVQQLRVMDLFNAVKMVDFQSHPHLEQLHPQLTQEHCASQLHLREPDGTLYGGFVVFKRLCFVMPMLYPLILLFYFPGAGIVGPWVYRWVAKNRYLFHFNKMCKGNACFRY